MWCRAHFGRLSLVSNELLIYWPPGSGAARPVPRRSRGGVAETGAVVPPERLRVDQSPGHPRLVARERADLEGVIGDAQGRLPEALTAAAGEPEPRVIVRVALQEDQRNAPAGQHLEPAAHQRRADAPLLLPGQHAQWAEHLHPDQPPGRVEQAPGEQDVPGDLPVLLGHQRQPARLREGLPQRIDQSGHDLAVLTERPRLDVPHGLPVAGPFFANLHARMVRTPPGGTHVVLAPAVIPDRAGRAGWTQAGRTGGRCEDADTCRP